MFFFFNLSFFFKGQHPDFSSTTHESPYFRITKKLQIGNEVKSLE
jgi:hypothetical protein